VLACLCKLAADIIRPKDPGFRVVHKRLQSPRFAPFFDKCIGALDGTHVKVVVPTNQVVPHMGRHGYTSQIVLALCDFDMRFTFAVAGWPGLVHDMRVFKDAIDKYGDSFPHPPKGIDLSYYLLFNLNALILHLAYNKLQPCREVLSCRLGLPKLTRLSCTLQGYKVSCPGVSTRTRPKR